MLSLKLSMAVFFTHGRTPDTTAHMIAKFGYLCMDGPLDRVRNAKKVLASSSVAPGYRDAKITMGSCKDDGYDVFLYLEAPFICSVESWTRDEKEKVMSVYNNSISAFSGCDTKCQCDVEYNALQVEEMAK